MLRVLFLTFVWSAVFAGAADVAKPALRVLRDQCIGCHKPGKAKGGLLLTAREKMLRGGDSGVAVVAGKPEESLLYQVLHRDGDPHMPPKRQLSAQEIASVKAWLDAGAAWDESVFDEPPRVTPVKVSPMPASHHPVLALALSQDESRLAVARGAEVIVHDTSKPERPVLTRLQGAAESVQSLAWSADGRLLAVGGFRRVWAWNAADWSRAGEISEGLIGQITALCFTPDGLLFAADGEAGVSGFIQQISTEQGRVTRRWKAHDDTIYALRVVPGKPWLASASADKMARMWSVGDGKLAGTFEGHTNHVLGLAFNHDGRLMVTSGADREVKVWDVVTRGEVLALGDRKRVIPALAWSADGRIIVTASDRGAAFQYSDLEPNTGTEQSSGKAREKRLDQAGQAVYSAAITRDGRYVFAGAHDGSVIVWDEKGKMTGVLGQ